MWTKAAARAPRGTSRASLACLVQEILRFVRAEVLAKHLDRVHTRCSVAQCSITQSFSDVALWWSKGAQEICDCRMRTKKIRCSWNSSMATTAFIGSATSDCVAGVECLMRASVVRSPCSFRLRGRTPRLLDAGLCNDASQGDPSQRDSAYCCASGPKTKDADVDDDASMPPQAGTSQVPSWILNVLAARSSLEAPSSSANSRAVLRCHHGRHSCVTLFRYSEVRFAFHKSEYLFRADSEQPVLVARNHADEKAWPSRLLERVLRCLC